MKGRWTRKGNDRLFLMTSRLEMKIDIVVEGAIYIGHILTDNLRER